MTRPPYLTEDHEFKAVTCDHSLQVLLIIVQRYHSDGQQVIHEWPVPSHLLADASAAVKQWQVQRFDDPASVRPALQALLKSLGQDASPVTDSGWIHDLALYSVHTTRQYGRLDSP